MVTERLYYREPGLLEFEAEIVEVSREGDAFITVLDRSAFYPTSGGQLHDTGRLGETDVIEVRESDSGDKVLHLSSSPPGEKGQTVRGSIDSERRQRHRRQHTAQHILSAVFAKLYDLNTESVHLGDEYGAIEFNTRSLTVEQLARAENAANQIVLDGLPVEILFVDSDEAARLPLRKPPARTGTLRLIKIEGCDYSACGGTHVDNTAEVGPIKITGSEKARGRILVKFLSGLLALDDYSERFAVTDQLSRALTCAVGDLPDKLERMTGEIKDLKKQLSEIQRQLLPIRAAELAKNVHTRGELRYIAESVADVDPGAAGQLARMIADEIEGLAILVVKERIVLAVGEKTAFHAGHLARALAEKSGLKGGGSQRQAQLGGLQPNRLGEYFEIVLDAV